jgi:hypothetical protein
MGLGLNALTLTAPPVLDYGVLQLWEMASPPGPSPNVIKVGIEFVLLPGALSATRGKVCWNGLIGAFQTCSGGTSYCPQRPPPPDSPPPPGVGLVLTGAADLQITASALSIGELFAFGGGLGVLRFGSPGQVLDGLNAAFGTDPDKPTSWHILRVTEVFSGGPLAESELLDKIFAIPVGGTDLVNPPPQPPP